MFLTAGAEELSTTRRTQQRSVFPGPRGGERLPRPGSWCCPAGQWPLVPRKAFGCCSGWGLVLLLWSPGRDIALSPAWVTSAGAPSSLDTGDQAVN